MTSPAVVCCLFLLLGLSFAQTTTNRGEVAGELDNLRKLEETKKPLDALPPSNVHPPTHEKTDAELFAESPEAVFIGRDVESLTHPTILSKVPDEEIGRGNIQGHDAVCPYLLDVTLGLAEEHVLHGPRLYNLAARLECNWTSCRLCQQRMYHVFQYCAKNGVRDFTMKGVCEDLNPSVQELRLKRMVFTNNPDSCRMWKDMQVAQTRCNPDDSSFCQGAYTVGEMCHALGLNSKAYLQGHKLEDLSAWFCSFKARKCASGSMLIPRPGVDIITPSDFGSEPGAAGLGLV